MTNTKQSKFEWTAKVNKLLIVTVLILHLTACGSMKDRLADIGNVPALTQISNPTTQPDYQPLNLPMPDVVVTPKTNSLWQTGSQAFFKDQRANKVGDILTVTINIKDDAAIDNESSRSRSNTEDAGLTDFLGIPERQLAKFFPEEVSPASLVDMDSSSLSKGTGAIEREEEINVQLAAMVSEILPNGNLLIHGRQEVRVNFEVRELLVTGVIRPEDITNNNSISYEKIAEARISYGGRGQLSDIQQPRYGQQVFDVVFPF